MIFEPFSIYHYILNVFLDNLATLFSTISPELTISCSSMTNSWLISSTISSSSIIPATIPK